MPYGHRYLHRKAMPILHLHYLVFAKANVKSTILHIVWLSLERSELKNQINLMIPRQNAPLSEQRRRNTKSSKTVKMGEQEVEAETQNLMTDAADCSVVDLSPFPTSFIISFLCGSGLEPLCEAAHLHSNRSVRRTGYHGWKLSSGNLCEAARSAFAAHRSVGQRWGTHNS